jgi:hypothetical protein
MCRLITFRAFVKIDRRKHGRLNAKILFLILPIVAVVVIASYLAKALRPGRIRGRSGTHDRASNPVGFWTSVSYLAP